MKIALVVLGCVVLLVAVVVIVGSLLPKTHVASRAARYRTTPDRVFTLIDGPQTWRSTVKKYEPLPDAGLVKRWRETDAHGETITFEAIERRPPSLVRTRIATPGLPYGGTWTVELQPAGEFTTVRVTENGEVYNPVFRFVGRFMIGHTRTISTYLQDLGTALQQNAEFLQ